MATVVAVLLACLFSHLSDNSKRIVGDGGRQGPRAGTREGPSDDEFAPNTVKGSLPRFDAWHPQTLSTSSEKSVPTISEEKITEAPTTDGPSTKGPTTEAPTTDGPTTDGPTTEGPTNKGPSTKGPSTKGPSTEGPTTEGPTTKGPSTEGPTTEGPTTEALTTEGPSTTEKVTGGLPDEVVAVGRTSVGSGSSPNIGSVLRPNQPVSDHWLCVQYRDFVRSVIFLSGLPLHVPACLELHSSLLSTLTLCPNPPEHQTTANS